MNAPFLLKRLPRQRGVTLLEVLLALGILGIIVAAYMSALSTGAQTTGKLDEQVQAKALARSYLEGVKAVGFSDTCDYPVQPSSQTSDFSVSSRCSFVETGTLQKIDALISRTHSGKPLLSLSTYKKK